MESRPLTPKHLLMPLRIIYFSLISGQILLFISILYQNGFAIPEVQSGIDILNMVSVLMFFSVPAGVFIANKKLRELKPEDELTKKLNLIKTTYIIKWAAIEVPGFYSLVMLMILQDGKQFYLFLFSLLLFILFSPFRSRIKEQSGLTDEEFRHLEKPE